MGSFHKGIEIAIIKEKLRNQMSAASIHFTPQIKHISDQVRAINMSLWITGAADIKITLGFNISSQIRRIVKIILWLNIRHDIASERHDIRDIMLLC